MAATPRHVTDHGDFCTWRYNGPAKRPRGFWHGHEPELAPRWAFALRGWVGEVSIWQTSSAKGGFESEAAAIEAGRAAAAETKERREMTKGVARG